MSILSTHRRTSGPSSTSALNTAASDGSFHLRITTLARNLSGPAGDPSIAQSFDQEAAAVLMSRIAVFKAIREGILGIVELTLVISKKLNQALSLSLGV